MNYYHIACGVAWVQLLLWLRFLRGKVNVTLSLWEATILWAKDWGSTKIVKVCIENLVITYCNSPVPLSLSPCQTAQASASSCTSLCLRSPLSVSFSLSPCCFWRCLRWRGLFTMLRSLSRNEGRLSHSAICITVFRRRGSAAGEVLKNTSSKMWGRIWYLPVNLCMYIGVLLYLINSIISR